MNSTLKTFFEVCIAATIIIVLLYVVTGKVFAEVIDLDIIASIESTNNPNAYNAISKAKGTHQITPICLLEWNNFHPDQTYNGKDLFTHTINKRIASWYLNNRIPQMLRYYGKPVTIRNILISYNAGISYVFKGKKLPSETKNYIKKYNRLCGAK